MRESLWLMTGGLLLIAGCGDSATSPPPQATRLAFLSHPGTVEGQVAWSPPIQVVLQDVSGNTVATASQVVTLTLATNPAGATLGGTTTVQAVNGIATFTDLRVALPGDGFVLEARSPGLTAAFGNAFSVRLTFVHGSVGAFHSCGLTSAGFAYCWGQNAGGQLGDGSFTERRRAAPVAGGLRFAQLSTGHAHTCGVTTGNVAYCWGLNEHGRLGDGTVTSRGTPTAVTGGLPFAQVSAGDVHTCGVTTAGEAYCWGFMGNGRLGNPTITDPTTPNQVSGDLEFMSVSAGGSHTCGVASGGIGYCWGENDAGQLGDDTTIARAEPVAVSGSLIWSRVSAGANHTCGVTTGCALHCWGFNNHGQLGDGTQSEQHAPLPVLMGQEVAEVTTGSANSCAVTTGGGAYCWGRNDSGQLGDGTIMSPRTSPTPVAGALSFARVSGRAEHSCGITTGNVAYCWGFNAEGQIGNGTDQSSLVPARVVH